MAEEVLHSHLEITLSHWLASDQSGTALDLTDGNFSVLLRRNRKQPSRVIFWIKIKPGGENRLKAIGFQSDFSGYRFMEILDATADKLLRLWQQIGGNLERTQIRSLNDTVSKKQIVGIVSVLCVWVGLTMTMIFTEVPPAYTVYHWMSGYFGPKVSAGAALIVMSPAGLLLAVIFSRVFLGKRRTSQEEKNT